MCTGVYTYICKWLSAISAICATRVTLLLTITAKSEYKMKAEDASHVRNPGCSYLPLAAIGALSHISVIDTIQLAITANMDFLIHCRNPR